MGFDIGATERIHASELRPGDVFLRRPDLPMRVRSIRRRRNGQLIVLGWAVEPRASIAATVPITTYAPDDAVERVVERFTR